MTPCQCPPDATLALPSFFGAGSACIFEIRAVILWKSSSAFSYRALCFPTKLSDKYSPYLIRQEISPLPYTHGLLLEVFPPWELVSLARLAFALKKHQSELTHGSPPCFGLSTSRGLRVCFEKETSAHPGLNCLCYRINEASPVQQLVGLTQPPTLPWMQFCSS